MDSELVWVVMLAFGAVAAAVYVVGDYLSLQGRIRRRLVVPALRPVSSGAPAAAEAPPDQESALQAFVVRHFGEQRFGLDESVQGKLRRDLIKAGYFRSDALNYYIFARLVAAVVIPGAVYLCVQTFLTGMPWQLKLVATAVAFLVGIAGPDAYISRRQGHLVEKYRQSFPDMLDLLVVCVDAGLSLEAGLDRVRSEIVRQNKELSINLSIMGAEVRAGRSIVDALTTLAERLGLDEARAFATMLRQSIELGTDVAETLRIYSDEMRDRRLLRAEEVAGKLPVKMVLPLALFIFPVVLLAVMFPVGVRLAKLFSM